MSALKDVLARAEKWSPAAQEELLEMALAIEDSQSSAFVDLDEHDYAIIDQRMKENAAGAIASDEEVEALFAKYRAV